MTDDQINAAIAKACGWTDIHDDPTWGWLGNPPDLQGSKWPLLRYTECLNAMHEAEKTLFPYYATVYSNKLAITTKAEYSDDIEYFCATARQRAEAFLRATGKWEEEAK